MLKVFDVGKFRFFLFSLGLFKKRREDYMIYMYTNSNTL